jgi:hypothetical protein
MDDDAFVDRLPHAYATAIRLQRSGADATLIANALDVDINAIPALLELAFAKLDGLLRSSGAEPISVLGTDDSEPVAP